MEAINKLQPDRSIHLRGFDDFGAAAAMWGATPTGFTVSGVFRDPADFAVLILWDADNFFEHPRIKYLPDFDFSGMVLSFHVSYRNLQPLDSPKYPTIDWPYLDGIRLDGSTFQIPLFSHATLSSGTHAAASGTFSVTCSAATAGDTLTLWFQNQAFQFQASGGETASSIAAALASSINAATYSGSYSLSAVASSGDIIVTASPAGADGNMIRMYSVAHGAASIACTPSVQFAGGSSNVAWAVSLDFTSLGIDQVRQMWLTFAPQLADSAAYAPQEWDATFSSWSVADPLGRRSLKVAGPGSVRIASMDSWAHYAGSSWATEASNQAGGTGWFQNGFARRADATGDHVTVTYYCQHAHDLYLGTSLYQDRGIVSVSIDGGAPFDRDLFLWTDQPVVTRRQLASGMAAGQHTVVLTVSGRKHAKAASWDHDSLGTYFYCDFLEAAVASDLPDAPGSWTTRAPAIDYDTDHGYKLPPARLLHIFDKLGYAGPMNEYIGVFWWNQRVAQGAVFPSVTVTFSGAWNVYAPGITANADQITLDIGGSTCGKTVFAGDTNDAIAAHFAYFINETYSGVWASASGPALTITSRSPATAYAYTFSVATGEYNVATGVYAGPAAGTAAFTGALTGGTLANWMIDPSITPVVNYAARCWHADLYAQVQTRGGSITSSFSFELVNPPASWAAVCHDGTPVATATGFGILDSTQCAPGNAALLAYQQAAYGAIAALQQAAMLPVDLQFGEFLWWYFPGTTPADTKGMAYYDAATTAAAATALSRPLATFMHPGDDPGVNGYADANFLRNRLRDHAQAIRAAVLVSYPTAVFELLYAYDVNYPRAYGPYHLGGRLNAYVNTPPEWADASSGYLDRLKVEALDFGAGTRSLDLAAQAIALATGWGWPQSKVRYNLPLFNGGCPWQYELLLAEGAGVFVTLWAFDHVNLLGWPVEEPTLCPQVQLL